MVANQSFALKDIQEVADIDRLLRVAEIFAMQMLGVTINDEDIEILSTTLQFYRAPEELAALFNEDYYANIKSHPFFDSLQS